MSDKAIGILGAVSAAAGAAASSNMCSWSHRAWECLSGTCFSAMQSLCRVFSGVHSTGNGFSDLPQLSLGGSISR